MIKSWSFAKEYKSLRKNILKSIDVTLKSGNIFFGNQLKQFEGNFNKLNNNKFGVAVGSGTDAILISLMAVATVQVSSTFTSSFAIKAPAEPSANDNNDKTSAADSLSWA